MIQTDWDRYYSKPYKTATFTRKITTKCLIDLMKKFGVSGNTSLSIVEFGGANSCFYDAIQKNISPTKYLVVDNNQLGLEKFVKRIANQTNVDLHCEDILNLHLNVKGDLVFSVGLIEHFTPEDTARAIDSHFQVLKSGGIAIISFPTPTFLYRITRRFAELLGLWIFHDERPLMPEEVITTIQKHATVLYRKTLWPIVLTQHVIVAKKF